MSYVTVEVKIDHGRVVATEPEKLPDVGTGLLTILPDAASTGVKSQRKKAELPLIRGDGKRIINPSSGELDASFWGD